MKIGVASDHRGVAYKDQIVGQLQELGHEPVDCGPAVEGSVDYPDFAARVADQVSNGEFEAGILVCGTGLGMCIAANKFAGVRATPCHDEITAKMSRLHNDANVLCLSADMISNSLISQMVEVWVSTEFEGGRHGRRLDKVADIESRNGLNSVQKQS